MDLWDDEESCGDEHYRQICQQMMIDEELIHQENQKKIKIGIKCLLWIPLVFLAMIFLTDGDKVIFLVLWIASLFGIAAYLIYVEYIDFNEQEKVRKYKNEEGTNTSLIGSEVEVFEKTVDELLQIIEEKKAEGMERVLNKLTLQKDKRSKE